MDFIVKRDGRQKPFDENKIVTAIRSAANCTECSKEQRNEVFLIAEKIARQIGNMPEIKTVEEIQDLVESGLKKNGYQEVAKAFKTYRDQRARERAARSDILKEIEKKLSAKHVENQNANVDEHSFGGRKGEADRVIMKDYALNYCMSEMSRNNHIENRIYIHDLDSYAIGEHNCLSIPFDDLLAKGFITRQTDVRPANSISTAFQLVAVLFQLQSLQQFGGCSATHLDWTMVPYVRKSYYKHFMDGLKYIAGSEKDYDKPSAPPSIDSSFYNEISKDFKIDPIAKYALDMTKKELEQAVEGMFHNLNTLQSRSGNQLKKWLLYW